MNEVTLFFILLALAKAPMNGLQVQQQIVGDGIGFNVPTTTLYRDLKRLVKMGLVIESSEVKRRQHIFTLTRPGEAWLQRYAVVYGDAALAARKRLRDRV